MHNLKNTELDKLLAKLVDDSITDEELTSLEQILDGDIDEFIDALGEKEQAGRLEEAGL